MKKELEALKESIDYYSTKTVGGGRKKRTVRVVTEEGKAKEEEIKEQGRKEKLRLNLQLEWILWILQSSGKWWKRRILLTLSKLNSPSG